MNLPSAQFSRLVTTLAFDITDPSLDLMIRSWDHISARFLNRLEKEQKAGQLESLRLLAIHDAVHTVFGTGGGFSYKGQTKDLVLGHALAATARASHDVLAAVFRNLADLKELAHTLRETIGLIPEDFHSGADIGADSAAHYLGIFPVLVRGIRETLSSEQQGKEAQRQPAALDWLAYRQVYFSHQSTDRKIA